MKIRFIESPRTRKAIMSLPVDLFYSRESLIYCASMIGNETCYQYLVQSEDLQAGLWEGAWIDVIYPWHILEANQMMMSAAYSITRAPDWLGRSVGRTGGDRAKCCD